jgi:hypothetical protein
MDSYNLRPYADMIAAFVEGRKTAAAFEKEFLSLFKRDTTRRPTAVYTVLNDLFSDVDAFCADPSLRDPDDLDEDQLRENSKTALQALIKFM